MKRLTSSALAETRVERDGPAWVLVFVRELQHPPEAVWQALTDPAELAEWAPFDTDRNLASTGDVTLTMAGADGAEATAAVVRRAEAPRLLEYTWEKDVLRWELEAIGSGTRLTLSHAVGSRDWLPKVAAGWHICLDVARELLAQTPFGRVVGEAAREHGWQELAAAYARQLGVEPAPEFPDEAQRLARGR